MSNVRINLNPPTAVHAMVISCIEGRTRGNLTLIRRLRHNTLADLSAVCVGFDRMIKSRMRAEKQSKLDAGMFSSKGLLLSERTKRGRKRKQSTTVDDRMKSTTVINNPQRNRLGAQLRYDTRRYQPRGVRGAFVTTHESHMGGGKA